DYLNLPSVTLVFPSSPPPRPSTSSPSPTPTTTPTTTITINPASVLFHCFRNVSLFPPAPAAPPQSPPTAPTPPLRPGLTYPQFLQSVCFFSPAIEHIMPQDSKLWVAVLWMAGAVAGAVEVGAAGEGEGEGEKSGTAQGDASADADPRASVSDPAPAPAHAPADPPRPHHPSTPPTDPHPDSAPADPDDFDALLRSFEASIPSSASSSPSRATATSLAPSPSPSPAPAANTTTTTTTPALVSPTPTPIKNKFPFVKGAAAVLKTAGGGGVGGVAPAQTAGTATPNPTPSPTPSGPRTLSPSLPISPSLIPSLSSLFSPAPALPPHPATHTVHYLLPPTTLTALLAACAWSLALHIHHASVEADSGGQRAGSAAPVQGGRARGIKQEPVPAPSVTTDPAVMALFGLSAVEAAEAEAEAETRDAPQTTRALLKLPAQDPTGLVPFDTEGVTALVGAVGGAGGGAGRGGPVVVPRVVGLAPPTTTTTPPPMPLPPLHPNHGIPFAVFADWVNTYAPNFVHVLRALVCSRFLKGDVWNLPRGTGEGAGTGTGTGTEDTVAGVAVAVGAGSGGQKGQLKTRPVAWRLGMQEGSGGGVAGTGTGTGVPEFQFPFAPIVIPPPPPLPVPTSTSTQPSPSSPPSPTPPSPHMTASFAAFLHLTSPAFLPAHPASLHLLYHSPTHGSSLNRFLTHVGRYTAGTVVVVRGTVGGAGGGGGGGGAGRKVPGIDYGEPGAAVVVVLVVDEMWKEKAAFGGIGTRVGVLADGRWDVVRPLGAGGGAGVRVEKDGKSKSGENPVDLKYVTVHKDMGVCVGPRVAMGAPVGGQGSVRALTPSVDSGGGGGGGRGVGGGGGSGTTAYSYVMTINPNFSVATFSSDVLTPSSFTRPAVLTSARTGGASASALRSGGGPMKAAVQLQGVQWTVDVQEVTAFGMGGWAGWERQRREMEFEKSAAMKRAEVNVRKAGGEIDREILKMAGLLDSAVDEHGIERYRTEKEKEREW
ncbi:hypothetical protein HDU93_000818, partial [Gonapodya sp. JEL0774]